MEDIEMIDRILEWANEHPKFDTGFVENLREKCLKYDGLTDNQRHALENIIKKWRIDL